MERKESVWCEWIWKLPDKKLIQNLQMIPIIFQLSPPYPKNPLLTLDSLRILRVEDKDGIVIDALVEGKIDFKSRTQIRWNVCERRFLIYPV